MAEERINNKTVNEQIESQQKKPPNMKNYTVVFYLYEGWLVAQGPLFGKQPWGPGHRSAD